MENGRLDAIDFQILTFLREDARSTATEMADRLPVSGNTVRNRMHKLESAGVIDGYTIDVDFEAVGLPFHYLFVCTASIADRADLIERPLDVPGVVDVAELMTGERNVVIEAVGSDQDDITRIAETLDDVGFVVVDETLIRSRRTTEMDFEELVHSED